MGDFRGGIWGQKKATLRERLGRWEFAIWVGAILLICFGLFMVIPNSEAVRYELVTALKKVLLWCRGALVHTLVFGGPIILGFLMRALFIQWVDSAISSEEEIGEGPRFILVLLSGFVVGMIWLFALPLAVSNPEFIATLKLWGWATTWEAAPLNWGFYSLVAFDLSYLLWWFVGELTDPI